MKFSLVQKAFLALIVANVIWGAAAPIFKLSLQNIPPFTLAFWRFFFGAIILLAYLRRKARLPAGLHQDLHLLVLYALMGITINIIFFFLGLRLTYAINAPVIASGQPLLTMLLAFLFLHEALHRRKFLGMIVGFIGMLLIILQPLLRTGFDGSLVGNLFLLVAAAAAVGQTIVGRAILPKYDPIMFTFWAFVIGSTSFLPLALYEAGTIPALYASLDWRGFLGIGYGALFASALGYGLFAWGLSIIPASDVQLFTYIDPVVGTVLGALLLHEPITTWFIVGAGFIFSGIFLAEGRLHYHPLHRLRGASVVQ